MYKKGGLRMISVLQIILIIVGLFLLIKGAEWFVDGASGIAEALHIPNLIIGLTIVAIGTSAPEAAVSITGMMSDNSSIAVGNVLGSNIFNALFVLGISGMIGVLVVSRSTLLFEVPYMLLVTGLFVFLAFEDGKLTFTDSMFLWGAFLVYIVYLIVRGVQAGEHKMTESREKKSLVRHITWVMVGLVIIFASSEMIVQAAEILAKSVGLSERLIALTVVSLGTSMPELMTSVVAAKKGKADIAIGNVIGSNIFNLLFIMGTIGLFKPLVVESAFVPDLFVALGAGALVWFCMLPKKRLNKVTGTLLLVCYVVYVIIRSAGM